MGILVMEAFEMIFVSTAKLVLVPPNDNDTEKLMKIQLIKMILT